MAGSLGTTLAGCALTMLVGMSTAQAASGRIAFSGAVVESTCSTGDNPLSAGSRASNASVQQRMNCGRTATDSGRSYSRAVISLADADLVHDRLLGYFASYARVTDDGKAAAKILVHTYE